MLDGFAGYYTIDLSSIRRSSRLWLRYLRTRTTKRLWSMSSRTTLTIQVIFSLGHYGVMTAIYLSFVNLLTSLAINTANARRSYSLEMRLPIMILEIQLVCILSYREVAVKRFGLVASRCVTYMTPSQECKSSIKWKTKSCSSVKHIVC